MDKSVAAILGAVTALAAGPAQAAITAPVAVMHARSYADLLKPIPNALEVMKLRAETTPYTPSEPATAEKVEYHHHHHHHHHRRHYHHHHHHGFFIR